MMFIKNNQALEISIETDDIGYHLFHEFIEDRKLHRVNDRIWVRFNKPDEKRFTESDLQTPNSTKDHMDKLKLEVIDSMDLNEEEEAAILFQEMDENSGYSVEIARKGLLSLSFNDWVNNLWADEGDMDWKEAMSEFKHIARGNDSDTYAEIYLQGLDEEDEKYIISGFETYAYQTPLYFSIKLIDCSTGKAIADDLLGGIYDNSYNLEYLFETIMESLDDMSELDKDLRNIAVDELSKMDRSSINW